MGLLGLLGFMGSFGSHGSHVSLGFPGPPGSLWSLGLNVILILLIEVTKLLGFSISEYLQMTWLPVFLSCWLILEVSCGAEDGEHLGERNTTVHCAVRQILAERTEMVCVMAAVMTTVSTETSICQLKILK